MWSGSALKPATMGLYTSNPHLTLRNTVNYNFSEITQRNLHTTKNLAAKITAEDIVRYEKSLLEATDIIYTHKARSKFLDYCKDNMSDTYCSSIKNIIANVYDNFESIIDKKSLKDNCAELAKELFIIDETKNMPIGMARNFVAQDCNRKFDMIRLVEIEEDTKQSRGR